MCNPCVRSSKLAVATARSGASRPKGIPCANAVKTTLCRLSQCDIDCRDEGLKFIIRVMAVSVDKECGRTIHAAACASDEVLMDFLPVHLPSRVHVESVSDQGRAAPLPRQYAPDSSHPGSRTTIHASPRICPGYPPPRKPQQLTPHADEC